MLLVPLDRNIDWRSPPVVTLCLVLANILLFVFWQGGDASRMQQATRFYFDSGLAARELPAWYATKGKAIDASRIPSGKRAPTPQQRQLALALQRDPAFREFVATESIVTPTSPGYSQWRRARERYEALLAEVVILEHGFRTAEPSLSTAFSHSVLHSGWSHLLGNMFFLIAVGALVERTLGRVTYLLIYLAGGCARWASIGC